MKLRLYQNNFIKTLADYLTRFRKLVAQLATGGGKTVIFAGIASRYLTKNNKENIIPGTGKTVLILVHRKQLLQQTRKTCYNAFNIVCEPVVAGMKFIPPANVYVGMVETVYRLLKKDGHAKKFGDIGILIIDECHRLEFMKLLQYFDKSFVIGFSATPITASKKKPLKNFYDEIVCGIDIPDLIKDGHLCQNITYAPKDTVDRIKLAAQKGGILGNDFNDHVMGLEFRKAKYIHNTVSAYDKWTPKTKCIIFNVNILHSEAVCKAFNESGHKAMHIDGEMNDKERDKILLWFHSTPEAILCNVGIATTGFDQPDIETVIVNKATMSMPLWLQMCGRGSRPTPAKSAFTIIDMGGNAITHGDWCQSRDWYDLFHNPGKPGKNNVAPVKICPKCMAVIAAAARECPICQYVFPTKEIAVEADLHEFIVITKNIDVNKVIEDNKHKKDYYPFWKIGTDLAKHAKDTIPEMTDVYAEFILNKYHDLARQWLKKYNEIHSRRKQFNQWHQVSAKNHLYSEISKLFPDWKSNLIPVTPDPEISSIDRLKALEQIHYNS